MTATLVISISVFIGVAAFIFGLAMVFRGDKEAEVEQRLSILTGGKKSDKKGDSAEISELISKVREGTGSPIEKFISQYLNLSLMFEQANVNFTIPNFLAIVVGFVALGISIPFLTGVNMALAPILGPVLGGMPIFWLMFKRKRRLKKFAAQLPEALELIARALRAGHSLAAGFNLVATETSDPIGGEFLRTYEEQNLGKPLEEALEDMTRRVPNLDLKFFATAVVLQRQTGGDLAEILDKIGHLVRERFQIWGQVQALTGEGRLSGIVLLALPPALFGAVYQMNPDYLMLLFTDDLGKKMLIGGVLMQLYGALVIRKIVNIRV